LEVIRLVVLMYVRFPLSLRNVEDLLFERSIDIFERRVTFSICDMNEIDPALGQLLDGRIRRYAPALLP
jgi:hypothetical protein